MTIDLARHSLSNWRLWLYVGVLLVLIGGCAPIQPALPVTSTTPASASPSPLESSPFGVVACLGNRYPDPSQRDLAVRKMAEAGIRWQREEFTWVEIEPQRGQFRWDKYDQAVDQQIAAGISLVGLLDYGAAWWGDSGTDKDMSPLSDEQLGEWAYFVRAVVERYKDRIHYWEIWNEENIDVFWAPQPNAADYIRLLQVGHKTITSVAPGSRILMGGTSGVDTHFIQQVYDLGGASYFDILAVHPYQPANPEGADPASNEFADVLTTLSTQFPGKPIWLTEVGWSTADAENWGWAKTGGGTAEQIQASYLVRMYVQALAMPRIEKIFWYDFRNDGTNDPHEANFGLVERDSALRPKQGYLAYQTMARLLEGAVFQRQVRGSTIDSGNGLGDDVYEYRFSKGEETTIVLWKSRGGSAPRSVTVDDIQAVTATLIQLDGNSRPVAVTNQRIMVNLTEEPFYLVFSPSPGTTVTPPSADVPAASATLLLMDVSGSMGEDWRGGLKIESAKNAATDVVNMIEQESQVGESDHQVAVATFTNDARLDLGLTTDYASARSVVAGLEPLNMTNIGAGLQVANQALASTPTTTQKIVILLSDGLTNEGLSSAEILAGPVQEAAAAGTCIYTVGFGEPGNLDETLLRQIAEGSGCGTYTYASAPDELERVYIRLRHQSLGTVLAEFEGQIAQGETADVGQVDVPRNQGELYVTLNWPGSDLDLILTDPRGRPVNENYPGVSFVKYERLIYLIVENPSAGLWQLQAYGVEVTEGILDYAAIVSVRERIEPPPTNISMILLFVGLVVVMGLVMVLIVTQQQRRPRLAPAVVQVVSGQTVQPFVALRRKELIIGRDSRCGMVLPGPQVSARHAMIQQTPQGYVLTDLGSRNGTFVNGQRVQQALLRGGERLRIGQTELAFATPGTGAAPVPPSQSPVGAATAYLAVMAGEQEFARYPVTPSTMLGRYTGCPVDLNADALVSHQHARLDYQAGQWIITDLGSGNGTFVNGQQVRQQALRHGDEVRVGNTRMRFYVA